MAQQEDKGFFDKLGEILNAPLPGAKAPASKQTQSSPEEDDDDSLLERVKDILNAQLPGTPQAESSTPAEQSGPAGQVATEAAPPIIEKTPELDEDDLDEAWWKQDWASFRAHQKQEHNGLDMKQRGDLEKFSAYQQQEKQRFDQHQQQEFDAFLHMQGWRKAAWKQAVASSPPGQKPPPPPWNMPTGQRTMPPGSHMAGPGGAPPPWMRSPRPGRRRS
jgi:hypothetical protein